VIDISVEYEDSFTVLTCTSTGGPAAVVSWKRDGIPLTIDERTYQQSQVIIDTQSATYQNRLRIVSDSTAYSRDYSCTVCNSRGNSSSNSIVVEAAAGIVLVAHGQDMQMHCFYSDTATVEKRYTRKGSCICG